ncbi:MAG: aldo/keto reductase [Betaproteobacteria bacterium]
MLDSGLKDWLRASPLGFGGAPLGNLFRAVAEDEAIALVRHARASGIGYFDTAPHYGNGLSEVRIGKALGGVARDEYILSSKVGRLLVPDRAAPREQNGYVDVLPYRQRWDYSRPGTLRSIDDSLQRLGVSRLDIVYIHDIDRDTHGAAYAQRYDEVLTGAVPALTELREAGTIAGFGLGVNDWRVCVDVLSRADLDIVLLAGRYTLLDQSALPELLPLCERRGVAVVIGGPYNSGILATGAHPADGTAPYFNYAPAPADLVARVEAIERVCAEYDVPLRAAALQFPLAHPAVASVIPGARTIAEFDQNRAFATRAVPPAFWQALSSRGLVAPDAPLPQGRL